MDVLRAAGFREAGTSARRLSTDAARTGFVDVVTFEKT
jgi:hypothetical protein